MSNFYKYKFISPEPIYSLVKEELKSYFDTGAVDDLLFPVYLNKCLEKLGKTTHAIVPVVLYIDNFKARLPDNFYAIREAWFCTFKQFDSYQSGKAFYTQTANLNSIQLSPILTDEVPTCNNPICDVDDCSGDCLSSVVQAVYKTVEEIPRNAISRQFLLKPGNISFKDNCPYGYNEVDSLYGSISSTSSASPMSADCDSFDLHDNYFVTTFREGVVDTLMYVSDYDEIGNQMIPQNIRIEEYIEAFIKYKVFETLTNQTNDETFNQLQQKMLNYKMLADEAFIMAELEVKKQDVFKKQRSIRKNMRRFDKYELPNSGYYKRRRRY